MSRSLLKKELLEAQARVGTLLHQLFDDADPDEAAGGDADTAVRPEAWSALRATNGRLEKEVATLRVQLADEQAARNSAQAQSDALGAALAARSGMCAAQLGGSAGGCTTPPAGGGSHPSSPPTAARHETVSPQQAVRRASDISMVSEGEEDLRERTASLLQELADFEASPAMSHVTEEEETPATEGDGVDGADGADDSQAPSLTTSPRGSKEEAALMAELHSFDSGAAAEQQDRLSELVLGQGVMLRRLEQRFARAQDAWEHGAALRGGGGGGGAAAGGEAEELQARCVEAELRASKLERQRDEAIDRANVAQAMLTAVQNENETLHELAEQVGKQLRAKSSTPGSGSLLQQMARRPLREPAAPASKATPGKVMRSKSVAASILGGQIEKLGGRRSPPADGAATTAPAPPPPPPPPPPAPDAKHPNAA